MDRDWRVAKCVDMLESWHKVLDESEGRSTRDDAIRLFGPECAVQVCMHVRLHARMYVCVYVCVQMHTVGAGDVHHHR